MILRKLLCFAALALGLSQAAVVAADEAGFRQARAGYSYAFPRDHGSHPDFKLEWWYLTGHLRDGATGRRFGFQATFFRSALTPPGASGNQTAPNPQFDRSQAFLSHIALLDVVSGKLHFEERLNRQGWDARAAVTDLAIQNGNWTLNRLPNAAQANAEILQLRASVLADAQLQLTFTPIKPKVIFGENGISRKSATDDAASHYVSFTRLGTKGTVQLMGETYQVEGHSWMDHEFSSSQLGPDQTGWDWASIQLHDGREIMLYRLRHQDQGADGSSQLTWIDRDSNQSRFGPDQWEFTARRRWTSPETDATYPVDFDLKTRDPATDKPRQFRLRPLQDNQEIVGRLDDISYWEGACDVLDESDTIIGQAYVELTGYDGQLTDRLR